MEQGDHMMVSICCVTFNHVDYIRQCLEGFMVQKTNFDYEVIINDDCSTDGTVDIIREFENKYPGKIRPIYHDENQWSKGIRNILATFVYPKARGKYYAVCEGDDYWTDPYKLQKQVDYLEAHPDTVMCFHNAMIHYEDGMNPDKEFSSLEDRDYTGPEIYEKWIVPTASVLFRNWIVNSDLFHKCMDNKNFAYGDILLFVSCAEQGVVHAFSDNMSVYRRQSNSYSYKAPMLPRCKHHFEFYKTMGSKYQPIAARNVLALSIPQFFVNIGDRDVRNQLLRMCWEVSPMQTVLHLLSFPVRFCVDKIRHGIHQ